jgi:translation initiation factor 2B subunit (eIF-2B alpha/beta/delta family)
MPNIPVFTSSHNGIQTGDTEQLTREIHFLSLGRERQEVMETNLSHQQPNAISCLFHINIIQQAIERNQELIQTYSACLIDLNQDERFIPTRNLYERLIEELREANRKMNQIKEDLSNSSSMQIN